MPPVPIDIAPDRGRPTYPNLAAAVAAIAPRFPGYHSWRVRQTIGGYVLAATGPDGKERMWPAVTIAQKDPGVGFPEPASWLPGIFGAELPELPDWIKGRWWLWVAGGVALLVLLRR